MANDRQDFDVMALLSVMTKDMQPNQMALVLSQLQAGNQQVIAAIQSCDKAALCTALGIERAVSDAKNDLGRDICSSTQAIGAQINMLGNRMDCNFRDVAKELCDIRVENLKNSFEAQLREKENMFKLAMLARDNQDAAYEEGHKTRALIRATRAEELQCKVSDLECKVSQYENQRFVRDAVCDELLIHRRGCGGGGWGRGGDGFDGCGGGFFHHGRRRHHGCDDDFEFSTRGCANVNVNIHDRRRRRHHDGGNDGGGHKE